MFETENMRRSQLGGLRAVAAFEFSKGILAVLVAFGLISLSQSDRDASDVVQSALRHLHVGADAHFAKLLMKGASRIDGANLIAVAMMVVAYGCLRFVESYGLWRARAWAEWMALLSGMIYLPLEIHHVYEKPGPIAWTTLAVNVAIVLYMAYLRFHSRTADAWRRPREVQRAQE